jgi:hypothetical protein
MSINVIVGKTSQNPPDFLPILKYTPQTLKTLNLTLPTFNCFQFEPFRTNWVLKIYKKTKTPLIFIF